MATATTTQTEYHVVKVCRSDGCDTGPGYWPVEAPKAVKKTAKDAPEKVTRTKPQMVRLAEDDPRFIEWRVKLGILLKQEISPYPNGRPPHPRISLHLPHARPVTDASYRGSPVVRRLPSGLLALREVSEPLGLRLPGEIQALQIAAGLWRPHPLALQQLLGPQGLLLRPLQRAFAGQGHARTRRRREEDGRGGDPG